MPSPGVDELDLETLKRAYYNGLILNRDITVERYVTGVTVSVVIGALFLAWMVRGSRADGVHWAWWEWPIMGVLCWIAAVLVTALLAGIRVEVVRIVRRHQSLI